MNASLPQIPHTESALTPIKRRLLCVALAGLAFGLYVRATRFDYVHLDDHNYVTKNKYVTGLTSENLAWAFTTNHEANWHPFTWVSYCIDAELYSNLIAGIHFTNVLLHAANVVLLFAFLNRATLRAGRSAFVAALFAVHPIHVESVVWLSERKDVLSMFFALLAMNSYVRYCETSARKWYAALCLAFVCSLLSKQTFVTLPCVLLLLDAWPLKRLRTESAPSAPTAGSSSPDCSLSRFESRTVTELIVEKIPLFLLTALFSVIVFFAQKRGTAVVELSDLAFADRFVNAVVSYALYLWKFVWPVELAVYYPHPQAGIPTSLVAVAGIVLAVITTLVVVLRDRCPALLIGWLWYLGTLVPMIGVVQVGFQRMADRYAYLPFIGLYIAIAWGLHAVASRAIRNPNVAPAAAAIVILLLAGRATVQIGYWRDSYTLFERTLELEPENYLINFCIATAYAESGRYSRSIPYYHRAIELDPDSADAHALLALQYYEIKDSGKAVHHLEQAAELSDGNSNVLHDLGNALRLHGEHERAVEQFEKAIEQGGNRDPAALRTNLGITLYELGDHDRAISYLREAVDIDPRSLLARNNLAAALFQQTEYADAIAEYEAVLKLDPQSNGAKDALAQCLARRAQQLASEDRSSEAISHLQRAVRIVPGAWPYHYQLGRILLESGDFDAARQSFEATIRLNARFAPVHNDLGRLLAEQGQIDTAILHFQRAIAIDPDATDARDNLRRIQNR